MQNLITIDELLEQFGEVQLKFDLYYNSFFIFQAQTNVNIHIMLMIFVDSVLEVNPNNYLTLNKFAHIIKDSEHRNHEHIKIKVSNDFTNIYNTPVGN